MKYFTPELYIRGQSPDEVIQRRGERLWEEEVKRYERHLAAILPEFGPSVRAYMDLLLHDAIVESISRQGGRLVMVLQTERPTAQRRDRHLLPGGGTGDQQERAPC